MMEMSPLLSAVVSFLFVIGLLLGTLWLVRAKGIGVGTLQGKGLRVVNSLRLGTKHRLDVVEYEGRQLLLGIAPNQITLLDNQAKETDAAEQPSASAAIKADSGDTSASPASFSGQLRQLMRRDSNN